MLPREPISLEETFDPENMAVLGGISYQMDWGQCKQKGRPFPSSVLWRVYPQHAARAPAEYSLAPGAYSFAA
jgi:hypothetical protein